jgi:hypothetical protein
MREDNLSFINDYKLSCLLPGNVALSNKGHLFPLISVLYIIVCPFVHFLLTILLSVLRFTAADYPFGNW